MTILIGSLVCRGEKHGVGVFGAVGDSEEFAVRRVGNADSLCVSRLVAFQSWRALDGIACSFFGQAKLI